jgi:hypothetical protein
MSKWILLTGAGRRVLQVACAGAFGLVVAVSAPAPSVAAIKCEGNFQVRSDGGLHNSPYCEDLELTHVARQAGMRVSFRELRFNPSVKERACRLVGYNLRVRDTCQPYLDRGRNRFY